MASSETGEIRIGDHILAFDMNTFCDLQDVFDVADINEVFAEIAALEKVPDFRVMRKIVRAALVKHHGELSLREAGEVMTQIGLSDAASLIGAGVISALPEAREGEEDDDPENPPKRRAARSTGSKAGARPDMRPGTSGGKRRG